MMLLGQSTLALLKMDLMPDALSEIMGRLYGCGCTSFKVRAEEENEAGFR